MKIEIWSDVICPWCYIGKRRFEAALAQYPKRDEVQLIWRSYELDPQAPTMRAGTLVEMLSHKYGVSLAEAAAMNARVTAVAHEVGLEYKLEQAKPGNTLAAHRLLHLAAERQLSDAATERVMQAYFCESLAVGDTSALARLAPEFGISESEVLSVLAGEAYIAEVRADEARANELGIRGVPFFLFDERLSVSGAQPIEVFLQALAEV